MPTPTFDGDNLLIILPAASPSIDVRTDLYSEWKLWALTGTNAKFPAAFDTSGGRDTVPGETEGRNFFLRNDKGWRIRPAEEDADVIFAGNLFPADVNKELFARTLGAYTVSLRIKFSSLAFVEITLGGVTQAELDASFAATEAAVEALRKVMANRIVVSADDGTVTVYEDDDTTVAGTFTVAADRRERTKLT